MKTALVTGAASRLGAPLARYLASRNFRILLHANRSMDKARLLAHSLAEQGAETHVVAADFADQTSIARFCGELTARFGAPDVIVNNASTFEHDYPGEADPEKLATSLSVHVLAPFSIIEAAAKAKKPGAVVSVFNILDHKLLNLNPDYYSYTLGKSALMALTAMWRQAERRDIRVFGLLPGLMFPSGPQTEERFATDARKIPTGRATPADQICAAIGFFLDHPDMPGQMLPIDGGEHLVPRSRDVAFE
ncbi:SDR family NAD(P)-dependent oxidoreductase [Rhodoblastus acidophilus]|uniref:SDR family NAD(P)-dependent oxidoreductase n=1 Tax=Candidatus Rhodoblastus alkanivorans TaxID=2954117 RepID=A0ABS9Z4W6_9HYPH|nr:SDR family NAD(P)-dependent oxidoreductase [Candidatus Rhodoblastus alkanivorans]MCI4677595.1 SDR family NAD(P)-dependent oxidoreductase [Candidatus Rhodoblastus alkanivorans]MCI4682673.1 SDR family NAD(P)-dependent oxidoreductase [Candidatus Rhodoblastus alkanivorans]MDI4639980.1 SDR family NAD(P)-dependent oxidoreductase [Rhodoblastus acidophilus]